jgi:hypothetical protein
MPCAGCGGGGKVGVMRTPDPEMDTSSDFIVTYPNGTTRRVWGEGTALSEVANYPDASYEAADAPKRTAKKKR